jgi:hypothetical protein
MFTYHRFTVMVTCNLLVAAMTTGATLAQPQGLKAPPGVESGVDSNVEVLTRGPLHEAFATPTTFDPVELPIIKRRPPEAIEELPPNYRPAGESVIWIPGYWQFDNERDDFIWLSGVWRNVPPGRQWVPGYWTDVDGGFRWVPGAWVEANTQMRYQPPPPRSQERGPSAERPSNHHFYAPGNWVYNDGRYKWRPGYWAPCQNDWVWIPARYTPARHGYVYSDGYWDYPMNRRGQVFAPVYFRDRTAFGTDFRYTPATVISSDMQLLLHLFVNPNWGQYVYGDYYGDVYASSGIQPWYEYHRSNRGYDPLFVYYDWSRGPQYLTNLIGWHKYFVGHPDYRPRHTLTDQVAFATQNAEFEYLGQAVLGDTLDNVLANTASANQFVRLSADQLRNVTRVASQIRGLTGERLRLESQTAAAVDATVGEALELPTQVLRLPKLPGIRVPQVGRDVPDLPLNLRNVAPQVLPGRGRAPVRVPVELPKLPLLPF